jgi:hypothetical protein
VWSGTLRPHSFNPTEAGMRKLQKKPSYLGLGLQKTINFEENLKKPPVLPQTVSENTNHTL